MSSYSPTDWVDGVTPVDAARLDKIEAGLVAAEVKALKAQANGYASLDSSGKVPIAQLPPVGADLEYHGAYAPASYEDGDLVVGPDNVLYMCVTPTSTSPAAWPGGPTPAPSTSIPYGTSLPPSPADGQEAILVDSTTNPTYQWRFRYNALSSSAYKWEFIGGTPVTIGPQGNLTTTTIGMVDLTTGPTFVAPRAGDYEAVFGITSTVVAYTTTFFAQFALLWGSSYSTSFQAPGNLAWSGGSFAGEGKFASVAAGSTLKIQAQNDRASAGSAQWALGWIRVTPVRVS